MDFTRKDPFRSFNFLVEIDGLTRAGFQECSGLDKQTAVVEYREGADGWIDKTNKHVRKLSGLSSVTNITLKRGITDSNELWNWYKTGEARSGSIILLDEHSEEKLRWNFINGLPTKWTGPSFNSTGNSIAIESFEIAYEELVRHDLDQ
jgi:phage tail-like protein